MLSCEKIPLSVIVPVYNGEKYIEKCLRSIQEQSMKKLEIVVVNDGSTDRSAEIVAEIAKDDPRIKLCVHPENMGLFQARLTGVNASHGEYISFVDADDIVSCDYFRLLYQKAIREQSDITIGQFLLDFGNDRYTFFNLDPLRQTLSLKGEDVFGKFIAQEGSCYSWHIVCNKLYTRTLWMDAMEDLETFSSQHQHFVMCEDIAFSSALWIRAKKVSNIQGGAYYYYNRANESQSTSGSPSREKVIKNIGNTVFAFALMEEQIKKFGLYERYQKHFYAWKLYYARIDFNVLKNASAVSKEDDTKFIRQSFQIKESDDISELREADQYFYSQESVVDYTVHSSLENAKKMICSDKKKVICFDIFDTLILRPFLIPSDIFCLMNDTFNEICDIHSYISFRDIRVIAERSCRARIASKRVGYEEITLDEIYEQIALDYRIDPAALEKLKALEKNLELRFCVQRQIGKELFELAKSQGKTVIICSDMYLPEETIDAILKKNGYEYDRLYLSSNLRVAKCTGNLFKHIKRELNLPKQAFVHIGDNWESDVMRPRELGWDSVYLPKPADCFCGCVPGWYNGEAYHRAFDRRGQRQDVMNGEVGFLGLRCALALVANKQFDDPFRPMSIESDYNADPFRVGYAALGPYLYAVTDWIVRHVKEANAHKIHFVARDGYLPMEAYHIFKKYDASLPMDHYLYVSRKAMALADVRCGLDLYSLDNKMNIATLSPYKLEKMLVEYYKDGSQSLQAALSLNDAVFHRNFSTQEEFHRVVKVLGDQLDAAKLEAHKQELKKHFEEEFAPNEVMFDIGYSGRVEAILSDLLQYPVNSLYLHSNNEFLKNRQRIHGFKNKCFYDHKPSITGAVREHVFMKLAPSSIGYEKEGGKLVPVFEAYKTTPANEIVTGTVQKAALAFVEDILSVFDGFIPVLSYQKDDMAYLFEHYLHYGKLADRKVFGCVAFEDDLGMGKNVSALNFWSQEMSNFGLDKMFVTPGIDDFNTFPQEIKMRNVLMPYSRWKKAICYFILDTKHFWERFKLMFKRKR